MVGQKPIAVLECFVLLLKRSKRLVDSVEGNEDEEEVGDVLNDLHLKGKLGKNVEGHTLSKRCSNVSIFSHD